MLFLPDEKVGCHICEKGWREEYGTCKKRKCKEGCRHCRLWPWFDREECIVCEDGYTRVEASFNTNGSVEDIYRKDLGCHKLHSQQGLTATIMNCKYHTYNGTRLECYRCKSGFTQIDDEEKNFTCKSVADIEYLLPCSKKRNCRVKERAVKCQKFERYANGCLECYQDSP